MLTEVKAYIKLQIWSFFFSFL